MANDDEVFSFLLEDVLSFERGQEVADMISVFLDPDITVQPLDGDVSLRGIIELQGEYDRLQESVDSEEGVWNQDTFEVRNFVDKVVDIGEARAIFSHQFPVEITIPAYRVNNIEDIKMEIENFDYELVAPDTIKIESSIIIHGINQEATANLSREDESTLFSIEGQTEDAKEQQADGVPKLSETSLERMPEMPDLARDEEINSEPEATNEQEQKENHEPLVPVEKEKQLHISARSIEEEAKNDPEEDETDEDADASVQDRNIDYLKSMFGGEQESGYTKVRLCIVQERDTVDSIAERYDVKKSQILIKNQLEDEALVEGQLLQIPIPK